jgi:glutamate synthase domain-containing protein 3
MTGGRVAVLGATGRNFAAGMSGGLAYVWDLEGAFAARCNLDMVDLDPLEDADADALQAMLQKHLEYTGSTVAQRLLAQWDTARGQFVKVFPRDYKRVLAAEIQAALEGPVVAEVAIHG